MAEARQIRRPDGVKVVYRRMKFDFEGGFERYWHSNSPFKSLFWTQLSTAFEPGEKFFVDSARALRDQLHDPALLKELSEFCRQEGHHTAQHLKFDRMNEAMGIDVASCERRFRRILDWARAELDPMEMLAATCALEHFTAGFADQYLHNLTLSEGADPRVSALWSWHAAEEAEHRATCFDIYRELDGLYRKRVGIMIVAWALILGASMVNTGVLLHKDKSLFTRDTLRGLGYLFGRRGLVTGLVPGFLAYFKPRFHPWKGVDATATSKWQAANERYIENLDRLPTNGRALAE